MNIYSKNFSRFLVALVCGGIALASVQAVELTEKDFTPDFVWKCRERAEAGEAAGQALYGRALAKGWGVASNHVAAIQWLRKAAEAGNAQGQCSLGVCYEFGNGVKKDLAKAVEWYRKAANQGHARAQCNLGACYYNGNGVEKNMANAIGWYRKAANKGYARAQCNLGVCYQYGIGVVKDMAEAVEWFKKASEQGYGSAQCCLGACYEFGNGVEKDMAKAVEWYRKAAGQEDASAQCSLGVCYEFGNGVEKNMAKAVEWYRKAANQGYARAQYNLGVCYYSGNGVEKNMAEAVEWYRKAAKKGYAMAQYKLGVCYAMGKGVERDICSATEWFLKAAEQEESAAQVAAESLKILCDMHPEVLYEYGAQVKSVLDKRNEKEEERLLEKEQSPRAGEPRSKAFDVNRILAKAEKAEIDGNVDFFGFFLGMSNDEAKALALHYGLDFRDWSFSSSALWFNLKSVRRITKGGNSADELAQAVANKIGTLKPEINISGSRVLYYEYKTIDGILLRFYPEDWNEPQFLSEPIRHKAGVEINKTND